MRALIKKWVLLMLMLAFVANINVLAVNAEVLDSLDESVTVEQSSQLGNSSNMDSITDYMRGYTPVTSENMEKASVTASPIINVIGTISGFIVMVTSAAIFMVTAADLAYIGLPFTRAWLNPMYASGGAQAGGMPMGGMGMGGMGAMGGGAQAPVESGLRRRWVSDEAVYCVNTYCQPQQQAQGGMPMGGGMGMQQQLPMKSVIFEYLKKRTFFLILFAVAITVLMSSIFLDCGLNLGELVLKMFTKFSGQVSQVQI